MTPLTASLIRLFFPGIWHSGKLICFSLWFYPVLACYGSKMVARTEAKINKKGSQFEALFIELKLKVAMGLGQIVKFRILMRYINQLGLGLPINSNNFSCRCILN